MLSPYNELLAIMDFCNMDFLKYYFLPYYRDQYLLLIVNTFSVISLLGPPHWNFI